MAATPELDDVSTLARNLTEDELLTVNETARVLKVPVTWVYEHVRPDTDDRLPVVKLGKYLRFHRRDLQAFIDAKRTAALSPRRRR